MDEINSPKNNHEQQLVISYLTLRKAVGILGILLPVVLAIGVPIISNCNIIQDSISDYYFTKMGSVFVGTLYAVGLFLFSYKGYERKDSIASKLACLFALGVAFSQHTDQRLHRSAIFFIAIATHGGVPFMIFRRHYFF